MTDRKMHAADVCHGPDGAGDHLEYIARMSQELANMAYQLDRKFIAYLLNMASMAAREEAVEASRRKQATDCLAE